MRYETHHRTLNTRFPAMDFPSSYGGFMTEDGRYKIVVELDVNKPTMLFFAFLVFLAVFSRSEK